jgi:predicted CopG family antitoxin
MGTKTIGLREDVYERLKARKEGDESFTELVDRLLEEATVEWRAGFGTLEAGDADALERAVELSRQRTSDGLAARQREVLEEIATLEDTPDTDETA